MSRLTGSDAFGLMEAYNNVYAPQELTEEQVWEEVEAWVNSLVEEGYDLSEYTWEDMYEEYLNELTAFDAGGGKAKVQQLMRQGIGGVEANRRVSTTGEYLQRQKAQASPKPAPASTYRPGGGGMGGMRGSGRDRTSYQTSSSPGALRVQPTNAPYQSRFAGARDAAIEKARQIQGSPVVGPKVTAQAPARTSPAPARPAVTSTPKPTTTTTTTAPATAPATPARTFNPLMQRTFGYQTGYAPSQVKGDIKKMATMGSLRNSFDPFDIVQGYLIDEGYAETEEAASVIMANMSEEWKESILESGYFPTKESQMKDEAKHNLSGQTVKPRTAQTQSPKPSK